MAEFPSFIFQDAIPAQQMMAHAQAINEGRRIAELGKARQQEGMYRMADLELRRRQQQEQSELQRMIAQSQISQSEIANSFKERELTQRGQLEGDRNKNYLEGLKIQYPAGRLNPQEAAMKLKLDYDRELSKIENDREEKLAQSLAKSLDTIDQQIGSETEIYKSAPSKVEGWYDKNFRGGTLDTLGKAAMAGGVFRSGEPSLSGYLTSRGRGNTGADISQFSKETKQYRSGQVPATARLTELSQAKKSILDQLQQLGWVYDPATKKIVRPGGTGAAALQTPQASAAPPPGAASLFGNSGGMIDLSDWQKATMGIQPGQSIVQDGVTYQVR